MNTSRTTVPEGYCPESFNEWRQTVLIGRPRKQVTSVLSGMELEQRFARLHSNMTDPKPKDPPPPNEDDENDIGPEEFPEPPEWDEDEDGFDE